MGPGEEIEGYKSPSGSHEPGSGFCYFSVCKPVLFLNDSPSVQLQPTLCYRNTFKLESWAQQEKYDEYFPYWALPSDFLPCLRQRDKLDPHKASV